MLSSIYDPLGLVSPFLLKGRKTIQELCEDSFQWDHPTPENIKQQWLKWKSNLGKLNSFKIARCCKSKNFGNVKGYIVLASFFRYIRYWVWASKLFVDGKWRWKGTLLSSHQQILCHTIEVCFSSIAWVYCSSSTSEDISTTETGTGYWRRYFISKRVFLDRQSSSAKLH